MWPFHNQKSILRKFGYYKDQLGILNRYFRENTSWEEHLKNTRKFILQGSETKKKGSIAILGSGWLLDVPLKELCSSFGKVDLFDIIHPSQIRHSCISYGNVFFVEEDISGLTAAVYKASHTHDLNPKNWEFKFATDLNKYDYVVSCNILDQLDSLLVDYLKNRMTVSVEQELSIRQHIHQSHLDRLPKGKSCIITDKEELTTDKDDKILSRQSLLYVSLPEKNSLNWIWHFDTKCTYREGYQTWFNVMAQNI